MSLSSTQRFLESLLLHAPVAEDLLLGQLHQALYLDGAYISNLEHQQQSDILFRRLTSEETPQIESSQFAIDIMMVFCLQIVHNCVMPGLLKVFLCVTFAALACGLTQGLLSLNEMEVI